MSMILTSELDEADTRTYIDQILKEIEVLRTQVDEHKAALKLERDTLQYLIEFCKSKGISPFSADVVSVGDIYKMSKEELKKKNGDVTKRMAPRAKSSEQISMPSEKELVSVYESRINNDIDSAIFSEILGEAVLEKHGIDPKTLNFKEGWGPNGKIETIIEPINDSETPGLLKRILYFLFGNK